MGGGFGERMKRWESERRRDWMVAGRRGAGEGGEGGGGAAARRRSGEEMGEG